jgi:hypothetical protein
MKRISAFVSALLVSGFAIACSSTDAGVTTKVKSQFAADDTVKAYEINVTTREGVVTLEGDVDSAAAKMRAVEIARTTEGVRDVVDQLVVDPDGPAATTGIDDNDVDVDVDVDDDIERKAGEAGDAIERGADAAADAARRAADRAEDAVDGDPDSNNDGK